MKVPLPGFPDERAPLATAYPSMICQVECVRGCQCSRVSKAQPDVNDPVVMEPDGNQPTAGVDVTEPEFSVALFDEQSAIVDYPWFLLEPGTTVHLESLNDEGSVERIVTTVSHERRFVNGVESAVVVDREYANGELIEETFDWYAQDMAGNVWYQGESSMEL